jgi:hypothetical protein
VSDAPIPLPILTGIGIGGLVVALAARLAIENIIGSLLIFADKESQTPFLGCGDKRFLTFGQERVSKAEGGLKAHSKIGKMRSPSSQPLIFYDEAPVL